MNLQSIGYPEALLAVIVILTLLGMWLLFGYGLSDVTERDTQPDRMIGPQQMCPKSDLPACETARANQNDTQ